MSTAAPGSRRWARGAAVITVATFLANGLAYVMSVVLSRTLGPSDYGAMAALLSLAVIGSIPQQGEQFLAARTTAPDPDARVSTARAWTAGSALLLVSCLAAPWATSALSLPSLWDLPLLGSMLLPLTVLGCYLGILLGSGRNLAFGALLAGVSAGRLLAALVGVVGGGSVTGFLLLASAATWLALLAAVLVTHGGSTTLRGAWRWGELVAATSAVAAVFIVTNTDVVAARVLLEPGASGDYGVAGLFARVAFWGPYALVLVVFLSPSAATRVAGRSSWDWRSRGAPACCSRSVPLSWPDRSSGSPAVRRTRTPPAWPRGWLCSARSARRCSCC